MRTKTTRTIMWLMLGLLTFSAGWGAYLGVYSFAVPYFIAAIGVTCLILWKY